ncbi:MAG: hypothetical protein N4A68_12410 [Maledivibacter sp.]|nr:hypothetical protein [Maledivibacter sp.]
MIINKNYSKLMAIILMTTLIFTYGLSPVTAYADNTIPDNTGNNKIQKDDNKTIPKSTPYEDEDDDLDWDDMEEEEVDPNKYKEKLPLAIEKVFTIKSLSEASEEDKKIICEHFEVSKSNLEECEKRGHSLIEAINISVLVSEHGFTIEEMERMKKVFPNLFEATNELSVFEYIRDSYNFTIEEIDLFKEELFKGKNTKNILSAYLVSKALGLEYDNLISNNETKRSLKGAMGLSSPGETQILPNYNINEGALNLDKGRAILNLKEIRDKVKSYHISRLRRGNEMMMSSRIKDISNNSSFLDYKKYFTSPFNFKKNQQENINLSSGILSYNIDLLNLPGRNGLDLNLGIGYNSQTAGLYEEDCDIDFRVYRYKLRKKSIAYSIPPNEDLRDLINSSHTDWDDYPIYKYKTDYNISTKKYQDRSDAESEALDWLKHDTEDYINPSGNKPVISSRVRQDGNGDYNIVHGIKYYFSGSPGKHLAVMYIGDIIYEPDAEMEIVDEDNIIRDDTYTEKNNNLGSGWTFRHPSIETTGISYSEGKKGYVHLRSGAIYKVTRPTKRDSNGHVIHEHGEIAEESVDIVDYPLTDLWLEHNDDFSNGEEASKYAIRYKHDIRDYLDKDGRLIGTRDRHGNEIKYQYDGENRYPNRIIDSLGRRVTINYVESQKTMYIQSPDGNNIKLMLQRVPGYSDEYVLKRIIDQNDRTTTLNYSFDSSRFNFFSKDLDDRSPRSKTNIFANLTSITYPTGSATRYDFEKAQVNLGDKGIREYYRMASREDIDKALAYNKQSFHYEDDYTGYSKGYENKKEIPNNFTYSTEVTDSQNTKIKYTFDKKHLKKSEEIYENNGELVKEIEYPSYHYDLLAERRITTLYDGSGNSSQREVSWKYDDNEVVGRPSYSLGLLEEYIDELGHITQYEYDETYEQLEDFRQQIDNDRWIYTEYDTDQYELNVVEKKRYHYETDENGEKIRKHIYEYYPDHDSYGNTLKKQLKMEDRTRIEENYEYSSSFKSAYLTKKTINVKDYNGNIKTITERYNYDLNTGRLLSTTDGENNKTTYEYDKLGRTTKVINPDSSFKQITYDDTTNKVTITLENGHKVRQIFDGLGRLIKNEELREGSTNSWITLEENKYNSLSRLEWTKDANENKTSYQYDIFGRITRITNPDSTYKQIKYYDIENKKVEIDEEGNEYITIYDKVGNLKEERIKPTNSIQYITKYDHDYLGKITSTRDARGNRTYYRYDDLGRLIEVENPRGEKTSYQYNNQDKIKKITMKEYGNGNSLNKEIIREREYDELGRVIKSYEPYDKVAGAKDKVTKLAYNLAGNIDHTIDMENQRISYTYDSLGRILTQTAKTKGGSTDSQTSYNYNNLNTQNIMLVTDKSGTTTYEYYKNGRLKKQSLPDDTNKYTLYSYYEGGNLRDITDPFGLKTEYTYDTRNRTDLIKVDGKTFNYDYHNDGMISTLTYPNTSIKTQYDYYDTNQLKTLKNKIESQIDSNSYDYDGNGNLSLIKENNITTSYDYDKLNRLREITKPNNKTIDYSYDARGNRKEISSDTKGAIDHLVSQTSRELKYNPLNQLVEYKSGENTYQYQYNHRGLRTEKITREKTTKYHNDMLGRTIAETDKDGNVTAQNIWGHKPLARKINGKYYYYLYNGHGDVVKIVDGSGNIVNRYKYDEWGNILEETEQIENPIKYAGEYFDEESSMYYLRARYYDPVIGRFVSKDSYEGTLTNPLSMNQYMYCYNNPLMYVDPSGHNPILMKLVEIAETSLPQILNEAQMLVYQYGPEIQQGGQYVLEYGSEIVHTAKNKIGEGIKYLKDKISGSPNSDLGLSMYSKETSNSKQLWGKWSDYEKVTIDGREYAKIGDKYYTRHAVDRMQPSGMRYSSTTDGRVGASRIYDVETIDYGRSISPTYVDDVLKNGTLIDTQTVDGVVRQVWESGSVQVVTEGDIVITIMTK